MKKKFSFLDSKNTNNPEFLEDINSKLKKELKKKKNEIFDLHKKYSKEIKNLISIIENFENEKENFLKKIKISNSILKKYKKKNKEIFFENENLKNILFEKNENLKIFEQNLFLKNNHIKKKDKEIQYFSFLLNSEKNININLKKDLEKKNNKEITVKNFKARGDPMNLKKLKIFKKENFYKEKKVKAREDPMNLKKLKFINKENFLDEKKARGDHMKNEFLDTSIENFEFSLKKRKKNDFENFKNRSIILEPLNLSEKDFDPILSSYFFINSISDFEKNFKNEKNFLVKEKIFLREKKDDFLKEKFKGKKIRKKKKRENFDYFSFKKIFFSSYDNIKFLTEFLLFDFLND